MTIYQRVAAAFETARVPGFLQYWERTDEYPRIPPKFCAYLVSRTAPALCADDAEIVRAYDVVVDLFGTSDVSAEAAAVLGAFEDLEFCVQDQRALADVQVGDYCYHRRFNFVYYEFL